MKASDLRTHIDFNLITYGEKAGKLTCTPRDSEGQQLLKAIAAGKYKAEIESIRADLKAKEADAAQKRAERKSKIDSIEGLRELTDAYIDIRRYRDEFEAMMEDESNDGVFPPKRPEANIDELRTLYPRADAYLKAKDWCNAANLVKSVAGEKAMERIIDGEDYVQAITDMEAEWKAHCLDRMWN